MKKTLFLIVSALFFSKNSNAQQGIIAIARYDQNAPPKLRYDDSLTEFSGGFEAFQTLFLKQYKMPTKALRGTKAADGLIGFTVNLVGKIEDIEVIDSVTTEIDAETVRVLAEIAEFHPQAKPLKFAILYNVYPDWFRSWVEEQAAAAQERREATRIDSLLESKNKSELRSLVDETKVYASGDVWAGLSTINDPLSKYLNQSFVFGADLNFFKRKWFVGGNIQFRNTHIKQDFDYLDAYWAKDTSVNLFGFGMMAGYKLVDEERLAFTPFVGIGFGTLSLPSTENDTPPNGSTILSVVPSVGFFVDYKYRVRAKRSWFDSKLKTSAIRLRLAVNPMNFRDGRRGSVVDIGLGFGFYQQILKL